MATVQMQAAPEQGQQHAPAACLATVPAAASVTAARADALPAESTDSQPIDSPEERCAPDSTTSPVPVSLVHGSTTGVPDSNSDSQLCLPVPATSPLMPSAVSSDDVPAPTAAPSDVPAVETLGEPSPLAKPDEPQTWSAQAIAETSCPAFSATATSSTPTREQPPEQESHRADSGLNDPPTDLGLNSAASSVAMVAATLPIDTTAAPSAGRPLSTAHISSAAGPSSIPSAALAHSEPPTCASCVQAAETESSDVGSAPTAWSAASTVATTPSHAPSQPQAAECTDAASLLLQAAEAPPPSQSPCASAQVAHTETAPAQTPPQSLQPAASEAVSLQSAQSGLPSTTSALPQLPVAQQSALAVEPQAPSQSTAQLLQDGAPPAHAVPQTNPADPRIQPPPQAVTALRAGPPRFEAAPQQTRPTPSVAVTPSGSVSPDGTPPIVKKEPPIGEQALPKSYSATTHISYVATPSPAHAASSSSSVAAHSVPAASAYVNGSVASEGPQAPSTHLPLPSATSVLPDAAIDDDDGAAALLLGFGGVAQSMAWGCSSHASLQAPQRVDAKDELLEPNNGVDPSTSAAREARHVYRAGASGHSTVYAAMDERPDNDVDADVDADADADMDADADVDGGDGVADGSEEESGGERPGGRATTSGDRGRNAFDRRTDDRSVDFASAGESEESDDDGQNAVVDLRGYSQRKAVGARLEVAYMERQGKQLVAVPYRGSVVSIDLRKGLRVKLDGYVRREWVTDEDEWEWLPPHDQAPLPHQQELVDRAAADGQKRSSKQPHSKAVAPAVAPSTAPAASSALPAGGYTAVRLRLAGVNLSSAAGAAVQSASQGARRATVGRGGPPSSGSDLCGSAVSDSSAPNSASNAKPDALKVTISTGPYSGEEARVLHVGNGWVKLQRPTGGVVHLRKWDLQGQVPLKVRSPSSQQARQVAQDSSADATAGSAPSAAPASERSSHRGASAPQLASDTAPEGHSVSRSRRLSAPPAPETKASNASGPAPRKAEVSAAATTSKKAEQAPAAAGPKKPEAAAPPPSRSAEPASLSPPTRRAETRAAAPSAKGSEHTPSAASTAKKTELPPPPVTRKGETAPASAVPPSAPKAEVLPTVTPAKIGEAVDVAATGKKAETLPAARPAKEAEPASSAKPAETPSAPPTRSSGALRTKAGEGAAGAAHQDAAPAESPPVVPAPASAPATAPVPVSAAKSGSEADGELKKPRKRAVDVLGDGFCVGASVWARWSGIKFSHGVIHKLPTGKWVLVKFDDDALQWVTARDLVLDMLPERESVQCGVEVIAAWHNDCNYYKGVIMGCNASGRFRVRYDDWDDALVDLSQVRLLPADFGKKKRGEGCQRTPSSTSGGTDDSEAAKQNGEVLLRGVSSSDRKAMEAFVQRAGLQLKAKQLEQLTVLLAQLGGEKAGDPGAEHSRSARHEAESQRIGSGRHDDPDDSADAESEDRLHPKLLELLRPYPQLLDQLSTLLLSFPVRRTAPKQRSSTQQPQPGALSAEGRQSASDSKRSRDRSSASKPEGEKRGEGDDAADGAGADAAPSSELGPKATASQAESSAEGGAHEAAASPASAPEDGVDDTIARDGADEGRGEAADQRPTHATGGSDDVHHAEGHGDGASRGPKGKGVRELSKLLHDFGDGSMVGVEISTKTRQRTGSTTASAKSGAALPSMSDAVLPSCFDESEASESDHPQVPNAGASAPLKKRPKLRQSEDP